MIATHKVTALAFEEDDLVLQVDDKWHRFALSDISLKLKAASKVERNLYTISPSGYGIHWPLIDEDLSVPALLKQGV